MSNSATRAGESRQPGGPAVVEDGGATEALQALRTRLLAGEVRDGDVAALVQFIDAALLKEDGEDAFDVFVARAGAGHLGALVDELRADRDRLRDALQGVMAAIQDERNIEVWTGDLQTYVGTSSAFYDARKALEQSQ